MLECVDGSLYTGISVDVERRLSQHRAGKGAKYTRSRLPVKLVWSEAVKSESTARKREAEIKGFTRQEKLRLHRTNRDTTFQNPKPADK